MGVSSNAEVAVLADAGAERTFELCSERFGSFTVPEARVFVLDPGLVGFPDARRFVLLDSKPGSPFKWMLSVDEPDLGFAVVDPGDFVAGYVAPLEHAANVLSCARADVALFVLVTIPERPTEIFLNLLAPIIVDLQTRRGRQLVLEDTQLDPAHRIALRPAPAPGGAAAER
jgi:flagellar assembly factor FliW